MPHEVISMAYYTSTMHFNNNTKITASQILGVIALMLLEYSELITTEHCMYIIPPEVISTAYFTNPSHQ
jgi:hypothetical protein